MPRKCVAVAMPTIHRHCATYCKPETKKTRDSSNACLLVQVTEILTDDQMTSQRFNSNRITIYCLVQFMM